MRFFPIASRLAMILSMVSAASVALSSETPASPGRATALFVSPDGNDRSPGTKEQPFATIRRAQQAVREWKARSSPAAPITVNLMGGTYRLDRALVFTPDDSGTAEATVTYRGVGAKPAVISGGRRLDGFRSEGKLWTARLDDVRSGQWSFNQLYVNGHRRPRARTPDEGHYFRVRSAPSEAKESRRGFHYRNGDVRQWPNLEDAVFVVFGSWYNTIHHVEKIDADTRTVWFTNEAGRPLNWYEKNLRYYVENIPEALDQAGEWYLDRTTGILSYYPLPGEEIETAEIIAPVVRQTLLRFQGDTDEDRKVEHIRLENLEFRHTDAHLPKDLFDGRQAATVEDAGLQADGASHCVVEGCRIANMGEHGIWFRDDCDHSVIRRCHVHDLGGGGIYIGEKWRWGNDCPAWRGYRTYEEIPHFTEHNVVDNCFVHDGCRVFSGAIGIWVGQASYTTVSHNDVCDMSYSGISVGWDWSGNRSTAHHNVIEHNHLHHLGHGKMNDMAGIYTLGVSPGTVIRQNVIHDVQAYQSPVGYCLGAGIYLDQSSAELTVENNVCYNISNAGFFLHHGAKNRVLNNVFADVEGKGRIGWGMYFTARGTHPDEGNTVSGNIVYGPSPKMAKAVRHGGKSEEGHRDFVHIDKNLYCSTGEAEAVFSTSHTDEPARVLGLPPWRDAGYDVNSLAADPLFVDAGRRNYRLRPDSPAHKLGIQSIDTAEVGLYGDSQWTGLPGRTVLRDPDPEPEFQPTAILSLAEDYEDKPVGYVPDHVQKTDRAKGAMVAVTDSVAADGDRCLRFADAPGLEAAYFPNRVWRDLLLHEGTVRLSFDCRNSRDNPATFLVELRDWSEKQYRTGPSLLFQASGTLSVGQKQQLRYEPGQWYHVEVVFKLGEGAPKVWQLRFAPKGEETEALTVTFGDSRFTTLTWLGLLAMDHDRRSEFFVDNLRIDMD